MTEKPLCFVIAPIGAEGTEVRHQSDMVLEYIIQRALNGDYHVKRADEDANPGEITKQMFLDIENAALIVCNLSGLNANVMYELGIAHARQKKVIHIYDKRTSLPFDIRQSRSIDFDVHDPQSHKLAVERLAAFEKSIRKSEAVSNPFTEAVTGASKIDKTNLKDSTISSLVDELSELSARMAEIEHNLESRRPSSYVSNKQNIASAAAKLINILNGRNGFERVVVESSTNSLLILGKKGLDTSDIPNLIDGFGVEIRIS